MKDSRQSKEELEDRLKFLQLLSNLSDQPPKLHDQIGPWSSYDQSLTNPVSTHRKSIGKSANPSNHRVDKDSSMRNHSYTRNKLSNAGSTITARISTDKQRSKKEPKPKVNNPRPPLLPKAEHQHKPTIVNQSTSQKSSSKEIVRRFSQYLLQKQKGEAQKSILSARENERTLSGRMLVLKLPDENEGRKLGCKVNKVMKRRASNGSGKENTNNHEYYPPRVKDLARQFQCIIGQKPIRY